WRTSGLLVAALLVNKDAAGARKLADETALLFPRRKPADADHIPADAAALLAAPTAGVGATLTLHSRPEGCEAWLGGVNLGKTPVDVWVLPGEVYYGHAQCAAGTGMATGPAATSLASVPRKISAAPGESTHSEVLDVEFERAFSAEGMRRLRF